MSFLSLLAGPIELSIFDLLFVFLVYLGLPLAAVAFIVYLVGKYLKANRQERIEITEKQSPKVLTIAIISNVIAFLYSLGDGNRVELTIATVILQGLLVIAIAHIVIKNRKK